MILVTPSIFADDSDSSKSKNKDFTCIGSNHSVGKSLIIKNNTDVELKDGETGSYSVVITKNGKVVFTNADLVAELDDVGFFLRSKKGNRNYFAATVYLDELTQTSTVNRGAKKLYRDNFNCDNE